MKKVWNSFVLAVVIAVLFAFCAGNVLGQGNAKPVPDKRKADIEQRINLTLKEAPIKSAIQQIFSGLGYSYSIDQNLTGTATVTLIDVPFNDALYAVLKAGNATMRKEGAVYIFSPQKELRSVMAPQSMIEDIPLQREKRIEKIFIGYVDATEIAALLGSPGGGAGISSGRGAGAAGTRGRAGGAAMGKAGAGD